MAGNVLVALDTSASARHGADEAAVLARALGRDLTLFLCVDGPVSRGLAEFAEVEHLTIDGAAMSYLERTSQELSGDGLTVSYHETESSDAAGAIVAYAEANDIGVIVMTTHGRTSLERTLLGSITDRVLRKSHVPIHVIPPKS